MAEDYISYIRSKVGHDKIFLNFAGGILTDDQGRMLLQKRSDNGKWGLPGGCLELGESSVDALKREFLEETGIAVEPVRFLNIYTNCPTHYSNGDETQSVVFLYEVKAMGDYDISSMVNDETLALQFFSPEETEALDFAFERHRLMISEYLSNTFAMGH